MTTIELLERTKAAWGSIRSASAEEKDRLLLAMAESLEANSEDILRENAKDMEAAKGMISDVMLDRLALTESRIHTMAEGIRAAAALPDHVGRALAQFKRPNGMTITKRQVPLGLVAIIYESRPNVTSDAAALCIKSGNVCMLRSGKEAYRSSHAIVTALKAGVESVGGDSDIVNIVEDTTHASAQVLMTADGLVDLLIPRGGKGLIDYVRQNATIPVIETGAGVCHVYFDKEGDVAKGAAIIRNAKTRRVSVCNALDCLIIDVNRLTDLSTLCSGLQQDNVEIYADDLCYNYLKTSYPSHLLKHASTDTFGTEFLDYKMAVTATMTIQAAVAHISIYGSGHSECIVTENDRAADYFMKMVDAACVYVNVPTSFTDGGEFGLGAEIGISTQKLHARGPMGLEELNTYKWIIQGDGQIRQ